MWDVQSVNQECEFAETVNRLLKPAPGKVSVHLFITNNSAKQANWNFLQSEAYIGPARHQKLLL